MELQPCLEEMKVKKEEGDMKYEAAACKSATLGPETAGDVLKTDLKDEAASEDDKRLPSVLPDANYSDSETNRLTRKRKRSIETVTALRNCELKTQCDTIADNPTTVSVSNSDKCVKSVNSDSVIKCEDWESKNPDDCVNKKEDEGEDDVNTDTYINVQNVRRVYRSKKSEETDVNISVKEGMNEQINNSNNVNSKVEGMECIEARATDTREKDEVNKVEPDIVVDDEDSQDSSSFEGFACQGNSTRVSCSDSSITQGGSEVDVEGDGEDNIEGSHPTPDILIKKLQMFVATESDNTVSTNDKIESSPMISNKQICESQNEMKETAAIVEPQVDTNTITRLSEGEISETVSEKNVDVCAFNSEKDAPLEQCTTVNEEQPVYSTTSRVPNDAANNDPIVSGEVNDTSHDGQELENDEENRNWKGPRTPEGPAPSSPPCPHTPENTPPSSPVSQQPPSPADHPPSASSPARPPSPSYCGTSYRPLSPSLPSILKDERPSITTLGKTHLTCHLRTGSDSSLLESPTRSPLATIGTPYAGDSGVEINAHSPFECDRPPLTTLGALDHQRSPLMTVGGMGTKLPLTTLGSLDDVTLSSMSSKFSDDVTNRRQTTEGTSETLSNKIPLPVKRKLSILEYRKRKSVNSESDASNSPSRNPVTPTLQQHQFPVNIDSETMNAEGDKSGTLVSSPFEESAKVSPHILTNSSQLNLEITAKSDENIHSSSDALFSRSPSPTMSPLATISSSTASYLSGLDFGVSAKVSPVQRVDVEEGEVFDEDDDAVSELSPSGSPPSPPSPGTPPPLPPPGTPPPLPPLDSPPPLPSSGSLPPLPSPGSLPPIPSPGSLPPLPPPGSPSPLPSHVSPPGSLPPLPPPGTSPPSSLPPLPSTGSLPPLPSPGSLPLLPPPGTPPPCALPPLPPHSSESSSSASSPSPLKGQSGTSNQKPSFRGTLADRLQREFGLSVTGEDGEKTTRKLDLTVEASSSTSPSPSLVSAIPLPVPPPTTTSSSPSSFPHNLKKQDIPNNFSEQRQQYFSLPPRL